MIKRWLQKRILRLFRRVSRLSLWFETRFTDKGRIVLGGAISASIFGIDPQQTLAAGLAVILIAALVVAFVCSMRWRPHIEVSRVLPDTVTVGVDTSYCIEVSNQSTSVESDLVFEDRLVGDYPDLALFQEATHETPDSRVNWFDRHVGFPRWLSALRRARGARLRPQALPPLPPGAKLKIMVPLKTIRRGKLVFSHYLLKRPDPFGLFYAQSNHINHGEVISLPPRYTLAPFQWSSERHFHHGGLALAATVGDSEEFIGLREYRPGDPLRHVHWRSFAKHGAPVIKEFQDEFFDRHALIFDHFRGSGSQTDFETAVAITASLIQSERPQDSILDLILIDKAVWRLSAGRGLSNARRILLELAEINASSTDDFSLIAEYLDEYIEQLASVILVTVNWDDDRAHFAANLRRRGLDCVVLQACDHPPLETDALVSDIAPSIVRSNFIARDVALATQTIVSR